MEDNKRPSWTKMLAMLSVLIGLAQLNIQLWEAKRSGSITISVRSVYDAFAPQPPRTEASRP